MRKKILWIVLCLLVAVCTMGLVACSGNGENGGNGGNGGSTGDGGNGGGSGEHTHQYSTQVVTPTCTEGGYTIYTCSCGETYNADLVEALGHTYGDWAVTTPATCTTDGEESRSCTCGVNEQRSVAMLGHTFSTSKKCDNCEYVADFTIGLEYEISDDQTYYEVKGIGTANENEIVIPSTYKGLPVKSIGESAFSGLANLISVTIPDSISTIKYRAFDGCGSLTSIVIPASVTAIEGYAFVDCYKLVEVVNQSDLSISAGSSNNGWAGYYAKQVITDKADSNISYVGDYIFYNDSENSYLLGYIGNEIDLVLPENINEGKYEIYDRAFYNNDSIVRVKLSNNVTIIGQSAFYDCNNLICVVVGSSVNLIGHQAFKDCYKLVEVINLSTFSMWAGSTYAASYALQVITNENDSKIEFKGDYIFYNGTERYLLGYIGNQTQITLPGGIGVSNYSVYDRALCNNDSILSVTLVSNVLGIGEYAFSDCDSLVNVVIAGSVTDIGEYAFAECDKLENVKIPYSVTKIGSKAFENSKNLYGVNYMGTLEQWASIDFRSATSNPTYYSKKLFLDGEKVIECNLTEISEIKNYAFVNCESITSLSLSDSVQTIGVSAFYGCNGLVNVTIPTSVLSLGSSAFAECKNLESISIPDSVTDIGSYAFQGCISLLSIEMPNQLIKINREVFRDCDSLVSVTIPDSVVSIDVGAFYNCDNLTTVTIGNGVTSIGNEAFLYSEKLSRVNYSKTIDQWARIDFASQYSNPLYYNASLYLSGVEVTEVNITTATEIAPFAFYRCGGITSVNIGSSVKTIGRNAFCNCDDLLTVTIANGVEEIDEHAFDGCDNLISVTLPDSITEIGRYTFNYCLKLETINLPSGITKIRESLFENCDSLTTLVIPEGVKSIAASAFLDCDSLISLTLPSTVNNLGEKLFWCGDSLQEINFAGTVEQWNAITKNRNWNSVSPVKKVICSDGVVEL